MVYTIIICLIILIIIEISTLDLKLSNDKDKEITENSENSKFAVSAQNVNKV